MNASFLEELDRVISSVPPESRGDCVAALILRALNHPDSPKIDMYGARISVDDNGAPGRKEFFVLPYNRTGSGANVIVACTTPDGREHFISARKYLDSQNRSKGLDPRVILPGGFMQPALPLIQMGPKIASRANDYAEELALAGVSIGEAYKQAAHLTKPQDREFDFNMAFCAMGEAHEETGMPVERLLKARIALVGENSSYGYSSTDKMHTVALHYMFDLGEVAALPPLQAASDVAAVWWSAPEQIQFTSGKPQPFASLDSRYVMTMSDGTLFPFRDDHAEAVDKAIKDLRNDRLFKKFGISLSTVESQLGICPDTYLGQEALVRYAELRDFAEYLAPLMKRETRRYLYRTAASKPSA